jgi:hypothetical protein
MLKKIAIQVVSKNKDHAYDRRRVYPFLAKLQDDGKMYFEEYHDLKKINTSVYDSIIINISSDLPFALSLLKRAERPKIILDFCDFIHVGNDINFLIKSAFAFLRGRYSGMFFKSNIITLFQLVDGIIVGSNFQRKTLITYNNNISVIPDLVTEIPVKEIEISNSIKGVLWEGFADSNLFIFLKLFKYWSKVALKIPLYIVTDKIYHFAGGFLGKINIETLFFLLNKIYPIPSFQVKEWNLKNLVYYSEKCSISIIPISKNIITRYKPENKIIIMLRLGLYPIVSSIPAYKDFEEKYNLNICFSNFQEFKYLVENCDTYLANLISVRDQILIDYSEELLMTKWKNALSLNN